MFALSIARPVAQRIKVMIVAGLFALSLLAGVAGTATTVSAMPPKTQPTVYCVHYSRTETIIAFGFDPGPTGYWNCDFTPIEGGKL
jgi:hypothetical protein